MLKKFFLIIAWLFLSLPLSAETIQLKSGKVIKEKIIEQTEQSIKVDVNGIPLTYYYEDIKTIDGEKLTNSKEEQSISLTEDFNISNNLEQAEKNAAIVYKRAVSLATGVPKGGKGLDSEYLQFTDLTDDIIENGWRNSHEKIRKLISENQNAIEEFKKATELPNCDFNLSEKSTIFEIPDILKGRTLEFLIRLVVAEGRLYEKRDEWDSALDNYLSVKKCVKHLNQQKFLLTFCKILTTRFDKLLYTPLSEYIKRSNITEAELKKLLDNFIFIRGNKTALEEMKHVFRNNEKTTDESVKKFLKGEVIKGKYSEKFYRDTYQEFKKYSKEYFSSIVKTLEANELERIRNAGDIYLKVREKILQKVSNFEFLKHKAGFKSPHIETAELFSKEHPRYFHIVDGYYLSVSFRNILTASTAIKLYELKNQTIPTNLKRLIPEYFSELPKDPFNGFQPLKYKKINQGWMVYSIGPDQIDNKGTTKYNFYKPSSVYTFEDSSGDIVFSSK